MSNAAPLVPSIPNNLSGHCPVLAATSNSMLSLIREEAPGCAAFQRFNDRSSIAGFWGELRRALELFRVEVAGTASEREFTKCHLNAHDPGARFTFGRKPVQIYQDSARDLITIEIKDLARSLAEELIANNLDLPLNQITERVHNQRGRHVETKKVSATFSVRALLRQHEIVLSRFTQALAEEVVQIFSAKSAVASGPPSAVTSLEVAGAGFTREFSDQLPACFARALSKVLPPIGFGLEYPKFEFSPLTSQVDRPSVVINVPSYIISIAKGIGLASRIVEDSGSIDTEQWSAFCEHSKVVERAVWQELNALMQIAIEEVKGVLDAGRDLPAKTVAMVEAIYTRSETLRLCPSAVEDSLACQQALNVVHSLLRLRDLIEGELDFIGLVVLLNEAIHTYFRFSCYESSHEVGFGLLQNVAKFDGAMILAERASDPPDRTDSIIDGLSILLRLKEPPPFHARVRDAILRGLAEGGVRAKWRRARSEGPWKLVIND